MQIRRPMLTFSSLSPSAATFSWTRPVLLLQRLRPVLFLPVWSSSRGFQDAYVFLAYCHNHVGVTGNVHGCRMLIDSEKPRQYSRFCDVPMCRLHRLTCSSTEFIRTQHPTWWYPASSPACVHGRCSPASQSVYQPAHGDVPVV